MIKFIVKLINLYKIINFTEKGDLIISYAGSKIKFTSKGDIIVNAKRHTIHHRDLFFDGCEQDFIDNTIKANSKGKRHLEKYVDSLSRASEFNVKCTPKERVKDVSN